MIMANSHLHTPNVNMQTPREMVFTNDNIDLFGSATYTPFGMGINTFAGKLCRKMCLICVTKCGSNVSQNVAQMCHKMCLICVAECVSYVS